MGGSFLLIPSALAGEEVLREEALLDSMGIRSEDVRYGLCVALGRYPLDDRTFRDAG